MSKTTAEDHLVSAENKNGTLEYRRNQWMVVKSRMQDMMKRMDTVARELNITGANHY